MRTDLKAAVSVLLVLLCIAATVSSRLEGMRRFSSCVQCMAGRRDPG